MTLNSFTKEKYFVPSILLVFFITFSILAFFSEGSYGGADDLTHYRFSRYAFQFPEFFLHHWAKPFYTLLAAPFAQFGFVGVRIFNVIIGSLTAYFTYRIAKQLGLQYPFMAIFFLLLSTLYPALMLSGMTEILFSFILVLSVFLFLNKNYIVSAIVLSFLPLVRTEGIILLIVFVLPFVLKRRFLSIAFLLMGFFIYSVIGGFYYHDFLWLITQMPYGDATDIYGTGSLFHFVLQSKGIFGFVFTAFIFLGIIIILYQFIRLKPEKIAYKNNDAILLILIPASAYYWAHSFSWYLGVGSSVGLIRVMAAIIPLFAIIALVSYDFLLSKFKINKILSLFVSIFVIAFLLHSTLSLNQFPVPLREKNQLIKEASNWIKNSEYNNIKVYYYDPYFFWFLDRNPYDKNLMEEFIPDRENPGNKMETGEILIWDAHFSANEGGLALSQVEESPLLTKLKVFKPENTFTVLGGHEYMIVLFRKAE
ncbi:MAG: hypothetical protein ABFS35_07350 [Bacteroidota bacterium]